MSVMCCFLLLSGSRRCNSLILHQGLEVRLDPQSGLLVIIMLIVKVLHLLPSNSDELDYHCSSSAPPVISSSTAGNAESWMVLSISGDKPTPRFNHAATVIGNKMIVVGGESGSGLLDDVQVLKFDQFTWTSISSKLYLSPSSLPLKIPACRGHSLVSWGKKALLIGGKTDPASDRISVWAFDTETVCWSLVEAKGDIPIARNGHTVVRASSVLILFGG
uniref:Uncharacterized protein n=1 Tax=Salix viminalis TaxID=40686 RepID=A0A6N2K2A0_SALVM